MTRNFNFKFQIVEASDVVSVNFTKFFTHKDVKIKAQNFFVKLGPPVQTAQKITKIFSRQFFSKKLIERQKMAIFGDF